MSESKRRLIDFLIALFIALLIHAPSYAAVAHNVTLPDPSVTCDENIAKDTAQVADALGVDGRLFTAAGAQQLLAVLAGTGPRQAEAGGSVVTFDTKEIATVLMLHFGDDPIVSVRFYRPNGCFIGSGIKSVSDWNALMKAGGFMS